MKTSKLSVLLARANIDLQKKSLVTYQSFLRNVCSVHEEKPWAKAAYPLLRGDLNKEAVRSLLDLADSLSSQSYDDALSHYEANQFASLIRKFPFPKGLNPYDPEVEAYKKFRSAEHRCHRINQRFCARRCVTRRGAPYEGEIHEMRAFIRYVLGDSPDLIKVFELCDFGPGASVGVGGNATNHWRKISSRWTVGPGAYHDAFASVMMHAQLREFILDEQHGFVTSADQYSPNNGPYDRRVSVVAYNNLAFVPKTAKTHRSIAVEPLLSGYLQKGADQLMRQKLKRIGIDLSLQEPNAEMARQGSLDDSESGFVTIDLSAASDSLAVEVVRDLLPPEWFVVLDRWRSRSYKYRNMIYPYSKFCSMGNGFCFPLETLIFVAACHAVGAGSPGRDFRVYGDDIIVKKSVARQVINLLAYLGFKTNGDKTFLGGPFRESCGSDWFGGVDVRPYILDDPLDSISGLFKLHNSIVAKPQWFAFFSFIRVFVCSRVPEALRFHRPYKGDVDTGLDPVDGDEHLSCVHCTFSTRDGGSWRWKELYHRPCVDRSYNQHRRRAFALLYAALRGSAASEPYTFRRKVDTKVRFASHSGATSQWLPSYQMMVPW